MYKECFLSYYSICLETSIYLTEICDAQNIGDNNNNDNNNNTNNDMVIDDNDNSNNNGKNDVITSILSNIPVDNNITNEVNNMNIDMSTEKNIQCNNQNIHQNDESNDIHESCTDITNNSKTNVPLNSNEDNIAESLEALLSSLCATAEIVCACMGGMCIC